MFCVMVPSLAMGGTQFQHLSKAELRKVLVNHSITDEAHWADTFLPDGQLEGHQLGNSQTGSWAINEEGDLCVTRIVELAESDCFQVWTDGNQVEYRQGNIVLTQGVLKPK
jgi:hypothetical protein